jgi:hypothetical protein
MMEAEGTATTPSATTERVLLRTMAERRRRVLWRVLLLVASLVPVLLLTVFNRERQSVVTCYKRMDDLRKMMENGQNPYLWLRLNSPDPNQHDLRFFEARFKPNDMLEYHLQRGAKEVGVCYCKAPHSPLFQTPFRHFLVYNALAKDGEKKCRIEMVEEEKAKSRAEELLMPLPNP